MMKLYIMLLIDVIVDIYRTRIISPSNAAEYIQIGVINLQIYEFARSNIGILGFGYEFYR